MAISEATNVYKDNGYKSRRHYLECLAEENGVDLEIVLTTASLYGPEEDFDGLVVAIQDLADEMWSM